MMMFGRSARAFAATIAQQQRIDNEKNLFIAKAVFEARFVLSLGSLQEPIGRPSGTKYLHETGLQSLFRNDCRESKGARREGYSVERSVGYGRDEKEERKV